ncbi:MAG: P-II family nitrogen regulator [Brevirhabdus sp.]
MRQIEKKKLLTIIAPAELQRIVLEKLKKRGIGGYTVVSATGAGASGLRSGMVISDSSVIIYIIMSEKRLDDILHDMDLFMSRGYRVKAFYQDISILPRKPPTEDGPAEG